MKRFKLKTLLLMMLMCVVGATQLSAGNKYTLYFVPNRGTNTNPTGGNFDTSAMAAKGHVAGMTDGIGYVEVEVGYSYFGDMSTNIPTIAVTGKSFQGWYDADGTKVFDASGKNVTCTYWNSSRQWQYEGNLTVYAKWTGDHRLTFNPNGGTITAAENSNFALKNLLVGVKDGCGFVTVSENNTDFYRMTYDNPTREGYTFNGWYSAATGGTQVYTNQGLCLKSSGYWTANGSTTNNTAKWEGTSDKTVYAQWSENVCKNLTTNVESPLKTAFDNASSGDVIQLTKDFTTTTSIVNTRAVSFTIDLNGHTINGSSSDIDAIIVQNCTGSTITIIDSKGEGGLTNTHTPSSANNTLGAALKARYGTIVVNAGHYETNNGNTMYVFNTESAKGGTIIVNGGTFKQNKSDGYFADVDDNVLANAGSYTNCIAIYGGTFYGSKDPAKGDNTYSSKASTYGTNGFVVSGYKSTAFTGGYSVNTANYTAGTYTDISNVTTTLNPDNFSMKYATNKLNLTSAMIRYMHANCYYDINMNVKYKGDYKLSYDYALDKSVITKASNSVNLYNEDGTAGTATLNYNMMTLAPTDSWSAFVTYGTPLTLTDLEAGKQYVRIQWASNYTTASSPNYASGDFKNFVLTKTAGYVTYNYNDGVTDATVSKQTIGDAYVLPTPTREGYTFGGWYDAAVDGNKITSETVFNRVDNPTLYAHWSPVDINAVETAISVQDMSVSNSEMNEYSSIGWFSSGRYFDINMNVLNKGDYKLTFNTALMGTSDVTGKVSMTLNNASGSTAATGATLSTNTITIKGTGNGTEGGNNWGWNNYANSHEVTLSNVGVGNVYLHTSFVEVSSGTYCGNFKDFKMIKTAGYVSFNLNGGTCSASTEERKITLGNEYGELPTPTREGYTFDGWYNGETLASATDKLTGVENVELTAKWTPAITDASGNVVSKEEWIAKQNTTPNDIAFAGKDADVEGANNVFVEQEEKDENEQPIYKAANLVVTDGTAFSLPEALSGKTCKAAKATYTRTTSSNWGTICLPYAVKSDDYVQYYELSKVDTQKGVMSFTAVDNVDANTPAVFCKKQSADAITPTNTDVPIVTTGEETSEKGSWKLIGTLSGDKIQKTEFSKYYIAQDKFWNATQASGEITIPAYRAYFQYTGNGAKVSSFTIAISDGDSTTAIGTIDANGNIQITEGKYMQDGKVTIVKNGKKYNTAGQTIK